MNAQEITEHALRLELFETALTPKTDADFELPPTLVVYEESDDCLWVKIGVPAHSEDE